MNKDEIARLRELLAKATPGPWEHHKQPPDCRSGSGIDDSVFSDGNVAFQMAGVSLRDANLIVEAVNELPSLLDTAKRANALEEEIKALKDVSIWCDGCPDKIRGTEWFIAKTTYGDRCVLRALPDEYSYDYTTVDDTYIKAEKIKCWMPFPDSEFRSPLIERIDALEAENKRLREERNAIIAALAPYPFCRHPTKCTKGRCEAEFCCND